MIARPLYTAAVALLLIVVGSALVFGSALLIDEGSSWLPAIALVALVTAVAGAGWGLAAFVLVGICAVLAALMAQGSAGTAALPSMLALYALAALPVLLVVSSLRHRLARATNEEAACAARLDAIGDGVLVLDAEHRVTLLNRAAERLTGWRAADARGKSLAQILRHANHADSPTAEAAGTVLAGDARHETYTLVTSDGEERCVVPVTTALAGGGCVILLRDATGWQREEQRLRALVDELWNANRGKDAAIARLSGSPAAAPAQPTPATAPAIAAAPDVVHAVPRIDPAEPDTQPFAARTEAPPEERVLMLCDDSDSAFALSMLLGMAGYEVKTAASAPEALQHARRFAPRVALIDTTMRDTDGCAAAKALRKLCAGLDLVALISPGASPDRHALAEAGYAIAVPKTEPLVLKRWLATRRAA